MNKIKDTVCKWLTGFTVTEVETIWQSREMFRKKYYDLKKKNKITK